MEPIELFDPLKISGISKSSKFYMDMLIKKHLATFAINYPKRYKTMGAYIRYLKNKAHILYSTPAIMGRTRADGYVLKWRLASSNQMILPMIINDITPSKYRYMLDKYPNDARLYSLQRLTIATTNLNASKEMVSAVFAHRAFFINQRKNHNMWSCTINLPTKICIIAPRDNRSNLFDFLEAYGDSLYSITLTGNKTIKIKTTVDP